MIEDDEMDQYRATLKKGVSLTVLSCTRLLDEIEQLQNDVTENERYQATRIVDFIGQVKALEARIRELELSCGKGRE